MNDKKRGKKPNPRTISKDKTVSCKIKKKIKAAKENWIKDQCQTIV